MRGLGGFERFADVRSLSRVIALVAALAAAAVPGGAEVAARAAAEPPARTVEGRLFTLAASPFGSARCGSVGVFPDGSLLLVDDTSDGVPAHVWRVGPDGTRTHVATVPGPVGDVVVDGSMSFVAVARFERRIHRFDLATGVATPLLELPSTPGQGFERVITLDDGSLVAYDGARVWRVRDGVARPAFRAVGGSILGLPLAPLAGGAFAFVDHNRERVVRVEADGRRRALMRLANSLSTTIASRDGELVVVHGGDAESEPRTLLSRFDGVRIVESVRSRSDERLYGDGDGFGVAALSRVSATRAWLADDGMLLLLEGCSLRALVPRASRQARIALRPSAWSTFAEGVVRYEAGTAGLVRLTVRRTGGPIVATAEGATDGGFGELRLSPALPRGDFRVRLELVTPAGGVTWARARIVTRQRLSIAAARRAVDLVVADGDGDGGDGWETTLGRCVSRAPKHVTCRVNYSWYRLDESWRRACRGWAHARLSRDGVRVSDRDVDCGSFEFPPTLVRFRSGSW